VEWWTNSTSEGFKVKQKCIVDQYSGTSPPKFLVWPRLSFGLAYTIDDGKGGKLHVNVSISFFFLLTYR